MIKEKPLRRLKSREPIWKNFDAVKDFNDPTKIVNGTKLERSTWVTLNRIRTHQGKCGSCLFK